MSKDKRGMKSEIRNFLAATGTQRAQKEVAGDAKRFFDTFSKWDQWVRTVSNVETNKANVRAFYDLAFNERKPEEAVRRYVGASYRQHNPMAGDGPDPFIGFVKWFTTENPELRVEFKRFIAEGDLVAVHCHIIPAPSARGTAAIDIFRL